MTVVSDNFNRSDRNPITPNWAFNTPDPAMQIISQQAVGTLDPNANAAYWSADVIGDDQFSAAEIAVHPGNTHWVGVMVRAAHDGTEYLLIAFLSSGADQWLLFKRAGAGSFTQIGSTVVTPIVVGQVMRLEAEGTTVTAKINGTPIITVTDSDIASGQPGIAAASSGVGTGALDNWSGGDLAVVPAFVPQIVEYA